MLQRNQPTAVFTPEVTDAERRLGDMLSSWGYQYLSQYEIPLSSLNDYFANCQCFSIAQKRLLATMNRSHSFYVDFLLPNEHIWIEVNGSQHYSSQHPKIQGPYDRARMSYIRYRLEIVYGYFFKNLNLRNDHIQQNEQYKILSQIRRKAKGSSEINDYRKCH